MRISEFEREAITGAIESIDSAAKIWLFGSRTDDAKRGGDIDIAILSGAIGFDEKIKIRRAICDKIGEQKIDLVVSKDGSGAFFQMASESGIRLNG